MVPGLAYPKPPPPQPPHCCILEPQENWFSSFTAAHQGPWHSGVFFACPGSPAHWWVQCCPWTLRSLCLTSHQVSSFFVKPARCSSMCRRTPASVASAGDSSAQTSRSPSWVTSPPWITMYVHLHSPLPTPPTLCHLATDPGWTEVLPLWSVYWPVESLF